jgi:uncharacterized FlaG/YvyC family protein
MNPSPIQPIGSAQQVENGTATQLMIAQLENLNQLAASRAETSKTEAKPRPEVRTPNSLENISLHFRVDDETNNVTIFLVDRKSHKVLRSIPAAELQKMQIGDLLKLTA